jgi:coenzyme Q-binding protein COQ10
MPKHLTKIISPHSKDLLFDLVMDIEKYPEFLPWCVAARIIKQDEDEIYADLVINFKGFREKYTSKVTYSKTDEVNFINVEMTDGPFTHLTNRWEFWQSDDGTKIIFAIDFAFRSKMLDKLIGGIFEKALVKMTDAFTKRADSRANLS